jgi:hypothetical protein
VTGGSWLGPLILGALLVAGLISYLRAQQRFRPPVPPPPPPHPPTPPLPTTVDLDRTVGLKALGIDPFIAVDDELTQWERGQADLNVRAERAGRLLQYMRRTPEKRFVPWDVTIPLALTDAEVEEALTDLRDAGFVARDPDGASGHSITAAGIAAAAEHDRAG